MYGSSDNNSARSGLKQGSKKRLLFVTFIAIATIFIIIFYANRWSSEQKITEIIVKGAVAADSVAIYNQISKLAIQLPKNQLNLPNIIDVVSKIHFVSSVAVNIDYSGKMTVSIVEKNIAGIIIDSKVEQGFVCDEGTILPYKVFSGMDSYPIIRGIENLRYPNDRVIKDALLTIRNISDYSNGELIALVSEIVINSNENIYLILNQGFKVRLGDLKDMPNKLNKLSAYLTFRTESNSVESKEIDLRWAKTIIES